MRKNVKTLIWGFGAMGSGMASMLLRKEGYELVSVIDTHPQKVGRDVGELLGQESLGVKVTDSRMEAFSTEPDIALIATSSFVEEVAPQIEFALQNNANVITIAEEMAYPWIDSEEIAEKLDALAHSRGKTVLGTGINPGFVLDTLIVSLSGVCREVNHIHGKRVNDLAPFGPTVMSTQGVGTTPLEFEKGIQSGDIVGHIGFRQSIMLIGKALGWTIDSIVEERKPIITNVRRTTKYVDVAPGNVAGCKHTAKAYSCGRELIFLEHPQQVCPEAEGVRTGDYIVIDGNPPVDLKIEPEIPGGTGTMAMAVNMIPLVMGAPSGLLTMIDLPVPRSICNVNKGSK